MRMKEKYHVRRILNNRPGEKRGLGIRRLRWIRGVVRTGGHWAVGTGEQCFKIVISGEDYFEDKGPS